MADWQEQLNSILSDPAAMAQIASIAQSLGGTAQEPPKPEQPRSEQPKPEPPNTGGIDAELLGRLTPLLQQLNRSESGEAAAFLRALRPYLSVKRRDKVERAAQLARLIHLGKTFLLSSEQEAGHV